MEWWQQLNATGKLPSTQQVQPKSQGIDPRAWISEIGGTVGAIGGGLAGTALGMPHLGAGLGGAAGSALGKVLEQKVKGEEVKLGPLATEAALSGVFAGGPIRTGKGLYSLALGKGVSEAAQKGVQKGGEKLVAPLTRRSLAAVREMGKATGITPSARVSGKALGVRQAADLQDFIIKKAKVSPTASSSEALNQVEAFSKNLANKITAKLKSSKQTYDVNQLRESIIDEWSKKTIGAGIVPGEEIKNKVANDILRIIGTKGNTHEGLWSARKLIDKQILNFSKSTDAASTNAQQLGQAARNVINKILGTNKGVKELFKDYSQAQNAIDLIAKAAASPKGVMLPFTGGARVFGETTQRGQMLASRMLRGEGLGRATERAAGRIPLGTAITRQGLATGLRGLVTPIPAIEETKLPQTLQEQPTERMGVMGGGQVAQQDRRLPIIAAAIQQDLINTGGKNVKSIQTLANLYGIDLSPIGLGTTTKKSTIDAATKRSLANIETGLTIVDELDRLLQSAGGGSGRIGGGLLSISARLGQAPEAEAFIAARNAYSTRLSKALGEVGTLTDQDRNVAVQAIPNITDSPRTVQLKLQTIRNIIQQAYNKLEGQFQQ